MNGRGTDGRKMILERMMVGYMIVRRLAYGFWVQDVQTSRKVTK